MVLMVVKLLVIEVVMVRMAVCNDVYEGDDEEILLILMLMIFVKEMMYVMLVVLMIKVMRVMI